MNLRQKRGKKWNINSAIPSHAIERTYAPHHLTDDAKVSFIAELLDLLDTQGSVLIGDVCFYTRNDLLLCKESYGDGWDDEEIYFVFSELKDPLNKVTFLPSSKAGGETCFVSQAEMELLSLLLQKAKPRNDSRRHLCTQVAAAELYDE
ncbi:hypothetical protein ACRQV7_12670 [Caproiciproducens sp. R2]|uniref:hypothetical protein n=1 Tax=Caproiciproducens sp. R2 TaxID=3435187 RepID=UPI0040344D6D